MQMGKLDNSLCASGWRDASQGERSEPRKVYGSDGITLLIGRVYRCCEGHEVVAYHPGVLDQIPISFVPFRLWHITGFTTEFIDLIVALVTTGISLNGIHNFLYKKYSAHYYSRHSQYVVATLNGDQFPSLDIWKSCFSALLPSVHALSGCFLADFWSKDNIYTCYMQNTTIDDNNLWLSLDHTFSSTSKY